MRKTIATAIFLLVAANGTARDGVPSDARLAKDTLLNVFRMAPDCKTRDSAQLAVQPLFFLLARSTDRHVSRVLRDLLSYNVGEANSEILDCIILRRGISESGFAGEIARDEQSDCEQQLGPHSEFCRSKAERKAYRSRMQRAIKNKEQCELQY